MRDTVIAVCFNKSMVTHAFGNWFFRGAVGFSYSISSVLHLGCMVLPVFREIFHPQNSITRDIMTFFSPNSCVAHGETDTEVERVVFVLGQVVVDKIFMVSLRFRPLALRSALASFATLHSLIARPLTGITSANHRYVSSNLRYSPRMGRGPFRWRYH